MRPALALGLAMVLAASLAAPARAFDPAEFARAEQALEDAVSGYRAPEILRARATFEALAAAEPLAAALHYRVAYADWRLVPLLLGGNREKSERYLKDGLDRCDRLLRIDVRDADAMALKGALQDLAILFDPKSVQTLGLQAQMNLHRAAALQSANPRVCLLHGIHVLHKPAQFHGGPAAADTVLHRAVELFARAGAAAGPTAPRWGRDDAYLWAGRCAAELKDWSRARDLYREALRVNPGNAWVRDALLPEAERALARPKESP